MPTNIALGVKGGGGNAKMRRTEIVSDDSVKGFFGKALDFSKNLSKKDTHLMWRTVRYISSLENKTKANITYEGY